MRGAFCAVFLLALVCLLPRAARVGMTGDYVDPIGKITAQDEALYGNSAIHMARDGDWMTPHFMGRLALYKPPLLIWISGLSARVFGITTFNMRAPVTAVAAVAIGVIFLWGAEAGGITAGACAALLVLSNRLFHTLSTLVMTDALLLAFTAAAVYAIFCDPWLESRASLWGFAACTAGAILAKGIAGVSPIAILGLFWVSVRPNERPAPRRVLLAIGLACALSLPWFVYQLAVHPRWFWTEHIAIEILGFGAGTPPQTSRHTSVAFYLLRLMWTDPILFSAIVVAVPAYVRQLRERSSGHILLAAWLAFAASATLAWQYHNASYLLALVPALALIAACHGPFAEQQHASWMLGLILIGLVVKSALPDAPWGLNYRAGTINPVAPALSDYCEGPRAANLIVVDTVDDLYAAVLPMQVRYASVAAGIARGPYGMPFRELGLALGVDDYLHLATARQRYAGKLREWGVSSTAPVGTVIDAGSVKQLESLIRGASDTDFLVPDRYLQEISDPARAYVPAARGFGFLLSNRRGARTEPHTSWTCRM